MAPPPESPPACPSGPLDLPALVDRWVAGWVHSRTGSSARAIDGGWDVRVAGSDRRSRETVLAEPDPDLVTAYAERVRGIDGSWMTLITRESWATPLPEGVVAPALEERLMTCDLTTYDTGPAGVDGVDLDAAEGRYVATLRVEGELAARGTVAVRGATAVFDQIRTEVAFQRRGLGRRLVDVLTARAVAVGATEGVLAASVEGRRLYTALGWSTRAHLMTLVPE